MRKRTPTAVAVPSAPEAELFLELQRGAIFFTHGLCLTVLYPNYADLEWSVGALNNWQPVR